MDKFEQSIKEAASEHEPSAHFVDTVMDTVSQPKRGWFAWPIAASSVAIVAVIAVLTLHGTTPKTVAQVTPPASPDTTTVNSPTVAVPGADDATLASDLSSIGSSVNQSGSDLDAADTALNDQQPTINEN